jgi:hypothetical protein
MKNNKELEITIALLINVLGHFLAEFISNSNFSLIIVIVPITILLSLLTHQ